MCSLGHLGLFSLPFFACLSLSKMGFLGVAFYIPFFQIWSFKTAKKKYHPGKRKKHCKIAKSKIPYDFNKPVILTIFCFGEGHQLHPICRFSPRASKPSHSGCRRNWRRRRGTCGKKFLPQFFKAPKKWGPRVGYVYEWVFPKIGVPQNGWWK